MTDDEAAGVDAFWRACNYLTVGQIYLQGDPLLRAPLTSDDIKPRLLGHWGTSPGLSFVYAHLNTLIRRTGQDCVYLTGPGHGGPALVAAAYLEGTYTEVYPDISLDEGGIQRLFRQFSSPGGIPSHVSVTTPGSIHEGGELGYVLMHAFGAVFDNPDLLAVAVVGDGEAETGPLEGSWKGISFLNPAHDGAVLPILHLNGYKIAGPTVLARKDPEQLRALLSGHGYEVLEVGGDDVPGMHHRFHETLGRAYATHPADPGVGAHGQPGGPAALARHRAAHAQGMDGTVGGRRRPGHRLVARASGAAVRRQGEPGAPGHPRGLDAVLRPGGALRRRRRTRAPRPGVCARRGQAHVRHSLRQRRARTSRRSSSAT